MPGRDQNTVAAHSRDPRNTNVWVALTTDELLLGRAAEWIRRGDCGAEVIFSGTVRDHAEGRPGVSELEYEAYASQVEPRLRDIAASARATWSGLGRIVLWHRIGVLQVSECSVLVAVSAGHRGEAFEAARYCIDTIKKSVPIWKRERWAGGEDWGLDAHDVAEIPFGRGAGPGRNERDGIGGTAQVAS